MDEILAAIDAALAKKGLSDAAASRAAVGHEALIKNLRKSVGDRTRRSTLEGLIRLAKVLDLEFYIGPPRIDYSGQDHEAYAEYVLIKRYDIALSAGPGSVSDEPDELSPVSFRADWLRNRGLQPKNCCIVSIRGDSMSPLLNDGDLALIDQSDRAIDFRNITAFIDADGELRVKRLEKNQGYLIIASENTQYKAEVRSQEDAERVRVIGRVVWSGRNIN